MKGTKTFTFDFGLGRGQVISTEPKAAQKCAA